MVFYKILCLSLTFSLTFALSPLQIEPEFGFPSFPHKKEDKTGIESAFTKARLPGNVIPLHYQLFISPILDTDVPNNPQFSAPGEIIITLRPTEDTEIIFLNSLDIDILPLGNTLDPVNATDPTKYFVTEILEPQFEFLKIELNDTVRAGHDYKLKIGFTSKVSTTKFNGLYKSSYTDLNGNESLIATTQFEATAARQAFPCFDEPWLKAPFQINIGYNSKKYIALGPTSVSNTTAIAGWPEGWMWNIYEETVPMSTYLVAIVVADYTYAQANSTLYPKPVRIYGPPQDIARGGGNYSANNAAKYLTHFEEYYGVDYKLSKMDSVAMRDFTFGAMENWGLNIYRDYLLLYFKGENTEAERRRTDIILAHELAHQWFGNLVTCEFWNQIWLNEGFATFNEYIASHVVAPEFETIYFRQADAFQLAMSFDQSDGSHPLINSANGNLTNDEIMGVFDRITYEKGGSLIRMMEGFLTPATLNKGLSEYLKRKGFQGAHQDDLFAILTEVAHLDGSLDLSITVKEIMDTWSLQSGFPLVRVSKASENRIYISQERFSSKVEYTEGSGLDPNHLWNIPLAVATAQNPDFSNNKPDLWLRKDMALIQGNYNTSSWIIVNPDSTGFYRVLYDLPLFNLLSTQFETNHSIISQMSRSQIFDDYFNFAERKFSDIENVLRLTKYLAKETKFIVWTTVFNHLRGYFNKLSGTGTFDEFRRYLLPRLEGALTSPEIGIEQLPEDIGAKVILRSQLLDWACSMEHPACLDYAQKLFGNWTEPKDNRIPIDIRPVVYCGAVSKIPDNFEKGWAIFLNPNTTTLDKSQLLRALGCTQDLTKINKYLSLVDSADSPLSKDEKIIVLQSLASNPQSRATVVNHVRENGGELIDGLGTISVRSFIGTLSSFVGTSQELAYIDEIIESNKDKFSSADMGVIISYLATINGNIKWRNDFEDRLRSWFAENNK